MVVAVAGDARDARDARDAYADADAGADAVDASASATTSFLPPFLFLARLFYHGVTL